MWQNMRIDVLSVKPKVTALMDAKSYLLDVDERYKQDAYHSLSIEGYKVTEELIEKVRTGQWNPEKNESDKENKTLLRQGAIGKRFRKSEKALNGFLKGKMQAKLWRKTIETGIVKCLHLALWLASSNLLTLLAIALAKYILRIPCTRH